VHPPRRRAAPPPARAAAPGWALSLERLVIPGARSMCRTEASKPPGDALSALDFECTTTRARGQTDVLMLQAQVGPPRTPAGQCTLRSGRAEHSSHAADRFDLSAYSPTSSETELTLYRGTSVRAADRLRREGATRATAACAGTHIEVAISPTPYALSHSELINWRDARADRAAIISSRPTAATSSASRCAGHTDG